jgi:thioredoxin 1
LGRLWDASGYKPNLSLRLALGLPTGTTVTTFAQDDVLDDVLDENATVDPTQLRLGSGAFSGSADLLLTQFVHPKVGLTLPVSIKAPFHRNSSGLLFGPSVEYGLGILGIPGGGIVLGGAVRGTWSAKSHEDANGELVNSGGHKLSARANVGVTINENWFAAVEANVPFWARVNGTQLSETYSLSAVVAWSFGGDDEEDQEGDEHDHSGADHGDVQHAARRGKSFDRKRLHVPGKITVVDFWADWCEPCKEVTATLQELAAKYPDKLAVRMVEVPAGDAPVAQEHLGGTVHLPLVWFLDANGKKVAELHGSEVIPSLVETVTDLVE